MAKGGGKTTAKAHGDSRPKYLGLKVGDGQRVKTGQVLVRQRGTKYLPGENVGVGKDFTLYALTEGIVRFTKKRKRRFDGSQRIATVVNVIKEES